MKINEITGLDPLITAIKKFSSSFTQGLYGFIVGKFRQALNLLSKNPAGIANIRIGDFVNSELAKINNINVPINERQTGDLENLSPANNVKLLKNKNSIQGAFVELGCCIALGKLMIRAGWSVDLDSLRQVSYFYQSEKQRVDTNVIESDFIATLERVSETLAQRIFDDIYSERSIIQAKKLPGFMFRVSRVGQSGGKPDVVLSIIGPEHPQMRRADGREFDREKNYSIKTKLGQKPNYTIKLHDGSLDGLIESVWGKKGIAELEPELNEFKELTRTKDNEIRRGEILNEVIGGAMSHWNQPIYTKRFVNKVIGAGVENMRTYIATAKNAYNVKSEVKKFKILNMSSKRITDDNSRGVTMSIGKKKSKSIQAVISAQTPSNTEETTKIIVSIRLGDAGIGIYATFKNDVYVAPGELPPSPNENLRLRQ